MIPSMFLKVDASVCRTIHEQKYLFVFKILFINEEGFFIFENGFSFTSLVWHYNGGQKLLISLKISHKQLLLPKKTFP